MELPPRVRKLLIRLGLPFAAVFIGAVTQAAFDWAPGAWLALIGLFAICAQAFYAMFFADIFDDIID